MNIAAIGNSIEINLTGNNPELMSFGNNMDIEKFDVYSTTYFLTAAFASEDLKKVGDET
jgi:hypothetical protein